MLITNINLQLNLMVCIIVTGTPGTGKTEIAKEIARKLKLKYISGYDIIRKEKLSESYDKKRKTHIVDEHKFSKALVKVILKEKKVIIDSHMSHFLLPRYVGLCIVTKCKIPELRKRMIKRKYNPLKIKENIDAELFDICFNEAYELGHDLLVIDTTKKKAKDIVKKIF